MEKKLLRLLISLALGIAISAKSNAMVIGSISSAGLVCENKNKFTFAEYSKDGFKKLTNNSKTFCGAKLAGGVKTDIFGADVFCGCVVKMGPKIEFSNKKIINEINRNNFYITKILQIIPTVAASIWGIFGTFNNLVFIFGNLINFDLDLNIDFEGAL